MASRAAAHFRRFSALVTLATMAAVFRAAP